jgi:hypothetical protein
MQIMLNLVEYLYKEMHNTFQRVGFGNMEYALGNSIFMSSTNALSNSSFTALPGTKMRLVDSMGSHSPSRRISNNK